VFSVRTGIAADYAEALQVFHDPLMNALTSKLSSNSDVLDKLVRYVIELNEDHPTTFMADAVPRGNSENCFLCGKLLHKNTNQVAIIFFNLVDLRNALHLKT
jgi:hypothetical protein